jgi:UDP-glucuronate 4-epimerase
VALRNLICAVEREVGRKAVLQVLPEQPGDVPRTFANVEKAKDAFGYVPNTGIAEGLVEFHRWYKEMALEKLDK